jgi:hypothetical protein
MNTALNLRQCECGTILSQYNKNSMCWPCQEKAFKEKINGELPRPGHGCMESHRRVAGK